MEISPSLPNFGEGKTQPPHLRSLTLHVVRAVVSPKIAGGPRSGISVAGGRCHFVGKTIGLLPKSWGGKIVLAGGLTPVAVTLAKMRQREICFSQSSGSARRCRTPSLVAGCRNAERSYSEEKKRKERTKITCRKSADQGIRCRRGWSCCRRAAMQLPKQEKGTETLGFQFTRKVEDEGD